MKIEIDKNSGYCFGVEYAIQMAEDNLENGELYCLGDIVHNEMEVRRLRKMGLRIIDRDELRQLKGVKVLIRAHGEPPETYRIAIENDIELIDASCPVVLKLQNRVKNAFDEMEENDGQVVIYGKQGHAEVTGLTGQTNNKAIVVASENDLDKIDFSRPVTLFSQTTKSTSGFYRIKEEIEKRIKAKREYDKFNDSICRQVSNREPQLRKFANEYELILFVSGKKSSNGKALHATCKEVNERSYFIESKEEIDPEWLEGIQSVGICGATSTPMWLMEEVAEEVENMSNRMALA